MSEAKVPRTYLEWRTEPFKRADDAAYTFGYHLIRHCRDEALAGVVRDASPEVRSRTEAAVDHALHNVMELLEGFWRLESGPSYSVEYALQARVTDSSGKEVEAIDLLPAKLDLPIGYWKWARDREFR